MEVLLGVFALLVVAVVGLGVLFGFLAFLRLGKLERRIAELERDHEDVVREPVASNAPQVLAAWTAAAKGRTARDEWVSPTSTPASAAAASTLHAPTQAMKTTTPSSPAQAPITATTPATPTTPTTAAPGTGATSPAASTQPTTALPTTALPATTPPVAAPQTTTPTLSTPTPAFASTPRTSTTPVPPTEPAREPPAIPNAAAASVREPAPVAKPFELERWLGVRGAAVLGGIFLAIAAFLFLQYSIERGWITPKLRVITATIAGIACFAAAFPMRRRYEITANAITGAGAVILYAAAWAASMLYGFISPFVAFAAMGAVTAACVFVAWKYGSQIVAVLGLVGGFATPIALSTGQDRPFALFGYILLLDLAFLFLSGKRRWPAIGMLALVGTTLIQGAWVLVNMDPEESWIGLSILGLFALTFASFAATRSSSERKSWIPAQTGALLLPFAFVLYFASNFDLAIPLGALALLAALLCTAAGVLARREETPWLPVGAAAGSTALLFTWCSAQTTDFTVSTAWTVVACALGLAGLQHAFAEWRRADGSRAPGAVAGAATSTIGPLMLAVYVALGPGAAHAWPWIVLFAAFALMSQRQAVLAERIALACVGAAGAAVGLVLQRFTVLEDLRLERDVPILGAIAALGALLLVAANMRRSEARRSAFIAVSSYFVIAMLAVWSPDLLRGTFLPVHGLAVGAALVLAIGALAAATGARSGAVFLSAALVTFVTQAAHIVDANSVAASTHWAVVVALLVTTTVSFAAWPLATRASWRNSALAWCTAAIQLVAWVLPVGALVESRYASSLDFVTPLAFAIFAALLARSVWHAADETEDEPRRVQRNARIAATMIALLFASSVVPIQVDREPAALTLAIFAAALAAFWSRKDSRVVKWTAILVLFAATLGIIGRDETWSFQLPPRAIWNEHAWIFLLPAACAVFAALRLRTHEKQRARGFELQFGNDRNAVVAGAAGIAAVLLVFAWINVEIAGLYAIGERGGLNEPHERGRALATSIAWAVYALALLALGVMRTSSGPRWASLILFLTTIGKVFLFDLGHLEGLQRAASMLGLALSLILVSLVYQRFVFRRVKTEPEAKVSVDGGV